MWGGWAESVVWFVCINCIQLLSSCTLQSCPGDLGSRNTSAFRWGLQHKGRELMDSCLDTLEDPFEDTHWRSLFSDNIWQARWQLCRKTCWKPCWQPCWQPCQCRRKLQKNQRPSGWAACASVDSVRTVWHCMTLYDIVWLCWAMRCFYALFCA